METSLFKDPAAKSGWHVTSIDDLLGRSSSSYDGSIGYRLRNYGCENNVLLADAVMLKRALNATLEAFRNAGASLRTGASPGASAAFIRSCIYASAWTRPGWWSVRRTQRRLAGGRNQEIVTAFDWARRGDSEATALGPLLRKGYDYLITWLSTVPGDVIEFKLRQMRRASPGSRISRRILFR